MPALRELPAPWSARRSAIETDMEENSGFSLLLIVMTGALLRRFGGMEDMYLEKAGPSRSTAMRVVARRGEVVDCDSTAEREEKAPAGTMGMKAVIEYKFEVVNE